jgi:hypothetical protein
VARAGLLQLRFAPDAKTMDVTHRTDNELLVEVVCGGSGHRVLDVGCGTVAAPLVLMQPGMGAGVAASRTPRPTAARPHRLVTHGIFDLGLYGAGWATSLLDTFQWRSFC